jgi:hypothetical protein
VLADLLHEAGHQIGSHAWLAREGPAFRHAGHHGSKRAYKSASRRRSGLVRGDAILVVAETQADIQQAGARLGSVEPGRLAKDRSAVDYIRVFGTIHCS